MKIIKRKTNKWIYTNKAKYFILYSFVVLLILIGVARINIGGNNIEPEYALNK